MCVRNATLQARYFSSSSARKTTENRVSHEKERMCSVFAQRIREPEALADGAGHAAHGSCCSGTTARVLVVQRLR